MWRFLKNLRRRRPRKVGLALSGGGARGLAHIGVLKVLEQENVPIDLLAGTSMGGVIAAIYATGVPAREMEETAQHLSSPRQLLTLVDRTLPRRGLLQGRKVIDYLARWLGELTFDQLNIPLALVAADLNGCQKVILREGLVLDAVRATIAIPGLFAPLERDHQLLIDGGLIDNLPVDVVRQMGANVVIAVDIATDQEAVILFAKELHRRRFVPNGLVDLVEVLWRSVEFLTTEVNRRVQEESPPDLLIHPTIPAGVTALTGFTRAAETIAAGEQAAREALPQIRALLGSPSS
jgi:NTE family protein